MVWSQQQFRTVPTDREREGDRERESENKLQRGDMKNWYGQLKGDDEEDWITKSFLFSASDHLRSGSSSSHCHLTTTLWPKLSLDVRSLNQTRSITYPDWPDEISIMGFPDIGRHGRLDGWRGGWTYGLSGCCCSVGTALERCHGSIAKLKY